MWLRLEKAKAKWSGSKYIPDRMKMKLSLYLFFVMRYKNKNRERYYPTLFHSYPMKNTQNIYYKCYATKLLWKEVARL